MKKYDYRIVRRLTQLANVFDFLQNMPKDGFGAEFVDDLELAQSLVFKHLLRLDGMIEVEADET